MNSSLGPIRPMLILPVVLIMLLTHGPDAVASALPAGGPDRLELTRLAALPASPDSPEGAIRFQTQVDYTLAATPSGYLAMFVFEDNAQTSRQLTSDPIPVKTGSGRATMDFDYVPASQVKTLTLIVGLFTQEQRLLGWAATNPMSLSAWTTRIEFQQAMAARMDGDLAGADQYLTEAIQASPASGNLYYWRADGRVRVGQYDDAIDDYANALKLMPQHRASMVGRAVALLWKQEWARASDDLTAALAMDVEPDEVTGWAHRARGIVNAALGKTAEAIDDYQAYLAVSPGASDRTEVEGWIAQLRAASG